MHKPIPDISTMENYMIGYIGLIQEGYGGLAIKEYSGLDILGLGSLIRANLPRPVHIMRQPIPHNGQTLYAQYAQYIGLDISNKHWFVKPAKSGRDREDIPNTLYTNTIGGYT